MPTGSNLTSGSSTTAAGPYTTASVSVAANEYALVTFHSRGSTPRSLTSVTDAFSSHLAWTVVAGTPNGTRQLSYAWAYNSSGSTQSGTLSLATAGNSSTNVGWSVDKFTGLLAVAPNQSVQATGSGNPATTTMSAYKGALSVPVFIVDEANNATASMSSFTFLGPGTNGVRPSATDDIWIAYDAGTDVTTALSMTVSSGNWETFGLELLPSTQAQEQRTDAILQATLTKTHTVDCYIVADAAPNNANLVNAATTTGTGPYTTDPMVSRDGDYLIVSYESHGSTPRNLSSVSGLGLTWSSPVNVTNGTRTLGYAWAYNTGVSGDLKTGPVTLTTAGASSVGVAWSVDKFVNLLNLAPLQSVSNTGTSNTATVTMSTYAGILSVAIFNAVDSNNKTAAASGFTFVGNGTTGVRIGTGDDLWAGYDSNGSPATTINVTGLGSSDAWSIFGVELAPKTQAHAHTTDAAIQGTATKTHSVDAAIYVPQSSGGAVDQNLATGSSTTASGPYATNAFEVKAGDYIFVTFVSRGSTPRALSSISDYFQTHLTWSTPVAGSVNSSREMSYAWAFNDSGTTLTGGLSLATTGSSSTDVAWTVDVLKGLLNTAPLQSVGNTGSGSPASATLSAMGGQLSSLGLFVAQATNATAVNDTGWFFFGGGANGVRAGATDDLWALYRPGVSDLITGTGLPVSSYLARLFVSSGAWVAFALEFAPTTQARVHNTDAYLIGNGLTKTHNIDAQIAPPTTAGNVNLINETTTASGGSYTTGVVAVEAGAYLLLTFLSRGSSPRDLSSVSGLGLTWSSPVALTLDATTHISYAWAWNNSGGTVYGGLTLTTPGSSSVGADWSVDKFVGLKNAAPQQSVTNTGSANPATNSMSAYVAGSYAVHFVAQKANTSASESGFTFLGAGANGIRVNTNTDHWIAFDSTSPTTALSMTIKNSGLWASFGLELLARQVHHTTDAVIHQLPKHDVTAIIKRTSTLQHTVDAQILKGASHSVDAEIFGITYQFTGQLGKNISKLGHIVLGSAGESLPDEVLVTHDVTAIVKKTLTRTHHTDAIIVGTPSKRISHGIDALIDTEGGLTPSPTTIEFDQLSTVD